MLGRRLLVLMAVLLGLTALAAALAPRPTVVPQRGGLTSPTPARATPSPDTGPSQVVSRTLSADEGADRGGANIVRAREGDTIRLSVRGDVLDAVELQGLDEIEPLEPGSPARFEFIADERGEHPIVLIDADRKIGELDVRPAAG
jgi:hypothetical protein